jgi:glycosyltransferase involved in cell wall biosynthesis
MRDARSNAVILQASAWYPPAHLGGTEIYLSGLVRELSAYGIASRIIAPLAPDSADGYQFDGTTVRTYSVNPLPSRAELRGDRPHAGFERFRRLLAEERPDIYHQHSWTRGLAGAHLRAAREAGAKTVITVHTPNNLCVRGTMMRFGREVCDGLIDPPRCGACWACERGAPLAIARALGAFPRAASTAFEKTMPGGRFATALSARAIAERRKREFARMVADADRIVAVSGWLFEALVLNGVPFEKLVLSRQGVDPAFAAEAARVVAGDRRRAPTFHLVFIGRWHPVKGIHVLVRAVQAIPKDIPLTLSIYAVGHGPEEQAYAAEVRCLVAGDRRIAIEAPVPRTELVSVLAQASALAVPSLWLETGPLVVLEAQAVGLPVIGSRLGGIAELVQEPEDGMLLPPSDVAAWTRAIKASACEPARWRRDIGATQVRTMREAAADMAALYASLCRTPRAKEVGVICGSH